VLTYNHSLQSTIINDNVNQFKVGLESDKVYFTLKVKTMTLMSYFFARKYNRQRRQLLFLVCLQVPEKSGVMKENCWTVVLVVVHRVFYFHFIISLKTYDMCATVREMSTSRA
jgi:hypothetical protein